MPTKRKRSSVTTNALLSPNSISKPPISRRASKRSKVDTNPDHNGDIIDGKAALRASPDTEASEAVDVKKVTTDAPALTEIRGVELEQESEVIESLTNGNLAETQIAATGKKDKKLPTKSSIAAKKGFDEIKAFKAERAAKKATGTKIKKGNDEDEWSKGLNPDEDEPGPVEDADIEKIEGRRPPPVHSEYLPLPWKGRLGYACLNTYLRFSNPPVFTSRTCRIASILEHRHPLKDPSQPEHSTKNRPDKSQPASIERGQRYVEELCLANVRDIPKMLRWNDKYGIKFMRLSSEMFPFASHAEYGFKLAPFASEALAEAGRVATELGHRLSTHPGQFTQLGSPHAEVVTNAVRDLEYHDELLSLLKLPEQEDRDAVIILHMGGTFGDKAATLDRFRQNYKSLSPSIKQRLVLENDDVSWSVHDLLPICEELNIPLCLDFHHHNIIFDSSQLREGTKDIIALYPRIKATWDKKCIRQKMHYSEPCPEATTSRQRRKHNPRPTTMPPCPNDMDLMIEAKDKEQAVFELMRTFKLPGWDTFNNVVPYERDDDNKPLPRKTKKKKTKKQVVAEVEEFGKELSDEEAVKELVPDEEIGMGGKENRVYWPPGMEEWLRPKKRLVKRKEDVDEEEMFRNPTPANFAARKTAVTRNKAPLDENMKERLREAVSVADVLNILEDIKAEKAGVDAHGRDEESNPGKRTKTTPGRKKTVKSVLVRNMTNVYDTGEEGLSMPDLSEGSGEESARVVQAAPARQSGRARGKRMSYAEPNEDSDSDE